MRRHDDSVTDRDVADLVIAYAREHGMGEGTLDVAVTPRAPVDEWTWMVEQGGTGAQMSGTLRFHRVAETGEMTGYTIACKE